jgi:hypothetical protein
VFALLTHRLCGRVVVSDSGLLHNGVATDHAQAAIDAARGVASKLVRATGMLVTVQPVLVIESEQLVGSGRTRDVPVIASRRVCSWLERQPEALDGAHAFRIRVAVGRSSTWR